MRIIKNNATLQDMIEKEKEISKFPMKLTCSECDSEFEVEESDLEVGELGLYQLPNGCPCCGSEIEIDDGIDLTVDNIKFPQHYYHFNGKQLDDNEINKYVKKCVEVLRNTDDKNFYHTTAGSGNTIIHVMRYEGDKDFVVNVCNGYYETNIPFTKEDEEKWCE